MGYHVTIDKKSGFCSGVIRAIRCAEKALEGNKKVYSLGAIVHNNEELRRLQEKGLNVIKHIDLSTLPKDATVLVRAHGEPPATYAQIEQHGLHLLECTCPVVLKLQKKIKQEYTRIKPKDGQIILFGKKGHAEVDGLIGQVGGDAVVIENQTEVKDIEFTGGPVSLFSQTTKNPVEYKATALELKETMKSRGLDPSLLKTFNTICAQVDSRHEELARFARSHSLILFVAGKESSNGKVLFQTCKEANPRSYAIENPGDISPQWFTPGDTVGVCGATSTPFWLMEEVAETVHNMR
ncbi:MAG: 4-hydroxy-3-methylbut-2-enyl diphosphate reductase [Bacteroidales bacterium]|nr:4-hydroxy-3-methylbut-2-enyl diphosphate reductase [Bacteroidales bacterium]